MSSIGGGRSISGERRAPARIALPEALNITIPITCLEWGAGRSYEEAGESEGGVQQAEWREQDRRIGHGWFSSDDMQIVTAEDAAGLADALKLALVEMSVENNDDQGVSLTIHSSQHSDLRQILEEHAKVMTRSEPLRNTVSEWGHNTQHDAGVAADCVGSTLGICSAGSLSIWSAGPTMTADWCITSPMSSGTVCTNCFDTCQPRVPTCPRLLRFPTRLYCFERRCDTQWKLISVISRSRTHLDSVVSPGRSRPNSVRVPTFARVAALWRMSRQN